MPKKCKKCSIAKSLESFPKHETHKDGRTNKCKKCTNAYARKHRKDKHRQRELKLRRLYDMSIMDYTRMVDKQGGRCGICEEEIDRLEIDHNHKTNKVRGLLCGKCNRGIGLFDDNINKLKAAILYLI